jgi:Raf kinase inhibitor-like YbhB/YbcL family protein
MRNTSFVLLLLASIPATVSADTSKRATKAPASLEVMSTAFTANNPIPAEYTCDGADTAPPLAWSKAPAATKSIALLVDDPDAPKGTFTHWLVTGIPATTTSLTGDLPEGAVAAKNDKGTTGYAGPCPPAGVHHYQFRIYALDIALPAAMTRAELLNKVRGHVVASGLLVGTYEKRAAH